MSSSRTEGMRRGKKGDVKIEDGVEGRGVRPFPSGGGR